MLVVIFAVTALAVGAANLQIVPGKAFNRIAIVYFENTDHDEAIGDPSFADLAKRGITLENYYAVTHPSQPNYVASIGGDYFGMGDDSFHRIAANVSTVIDLLEDKGISWAEYEESMPSIGFQGTEAQNPDSQAISYVRKHNPAVSFDANANQPARLAKMKTLDDFYHDLDNDALPQWMFITPNMTNDGHDTNVTVAGTWANTFLEPLLTNDKFTNNTLVLLTWDENHTYARKNRVLAILLGDAVPQSLQGTKDSTFYDHYSEAATVEANWDLHTLGRWDVGANVFSFVAQKTGDQARTWPNVTDENGSVYLNESYPGPYGKGGASIAIPPPDIHAVVNGRTVLPSIVSTWTNFSGSIYDSSVDIPDSSNPPHYSGVSKVEQSDAARHSGSTNPFGCAHVLLLVMAIGLPCNV